MASCQMLAVSTSGFTIAATTLPLTEKTKFSEESNP
jgi:hypothetical protein